jgi:ABC-type nitrate/sulfonate/bicarbonate transport system ATPase subunit
MIHINNLNFAYSGNLPIFNQFNWEVKAEDSWAVLGPSGCGKSTLLYLLAGLRMPSSGTIEINGQTVNHPRPGTGLILQDFGLLPWTTVHDNILLGLKIRKFYGPDGKHAPSSENSPVADSQVDFWIQRLGLGPVSSKFPGQISGGQRQRTAIARTLVLHPDLLLMDEPFGSLDALTRSDLQQLVLELCGEQKITLVIVTHSIEEAAIMGRKILVLFSLPGSTPTILDNPASETPGGVNSQSYRQTCTQLHQILGGSR